MKIHLILLCLALALPMAAQRDFLTADEGNRVRAAYGPCWERLGELKRRYDPDNVFHLNQNIDPGADA